MMLEDGMLDMNPAPANEADGRQSALIQQDRGV